MCFARDMSLRDEKRIYIAAEDYIEFCQRQKISKRSFKIVSYKEISHYSPKRCFLFCSRLSAHK